MEKAKNSDGQDIQFSVETVRDAGPDGPLPTRQQAGEMAEADVRALTALAGARDIDAVFIVTARNATGGQMIALGMAGFAAEVAFSTATALRNMPEDQRKFILDLVAMPSGMYIGAAQVLYETCKERRENARRKQREQMH